MKLFKFSALMWAMLLALGVSELSAKTITVNNNPNASGVDHTSLKDAYSAAAAGDTIFLKASIIPYGDASKAYSFEISKKVHLLGEGMGANPERIPELVNSVRTRLGELKVLAGAEGSSIQGIDFDGAAEDDPLLQSQLKIYTNNIVVARCGLDAVFLKEGTAGTYATHCVITQNFFRKESSINDVGGVFIETQCNYNIITNNILPYIRGTRDNANNIIRNNTVYGLSFRSVTVLGVFASDVKNNIILSIPVSGNTTPFFTNLKVEGVAMRNNLFPFATTSNDDTYISQAEKDNNKFGLTMTDVINATTITKENLQREYRLKTGSAGLGAGFRGEDCGAFGGATPFIISGTGALPAITAFTNVNGIKFQVKAKIDK